MPDIAADRFNPAFADLRNAIRNDAKISCIKALRVLTGLGLLETKNIMEAIFTGIADVRTDTAPVPLPASMHNHDLGCSPNDAHYVVCYRSGGEDYVHNFRDDHDNRDQAMEYARSRMESVSDSGNIVVAKVIATTKRTLVTL